ncbi:hypothetical protein GPECTOR_12g475 [Gonium pectorale]|uniref:Uncharacterized protein n=1 Tax=Gonium pectorale TaxID=33097 RepID=A0A150GP48_GONPE|nr:hypothetical protein GPECTOR_12g475 [Gonium pectorale]|eukprot:KXZ51512.1 hypothetical protein GPECTOR_12g475 [Gonium pectorale]
MQTLDGHKTECKNIYVKGRNVRFVHLPRSLDPGKAIDMYRHKLIRTKREAAKERARVLGSAKREAKGADAVATAGGEEGGAEAAGEGDEAIEGEGEGDAEGQPGTDEDEEGAWGGGEEDDEDEGTAGEEREEGREAAGGGAAAAAAGGGAEGEGGGDGDWELEFGDL